MISVLMPAYNAEKYLDKAIQSVINQSHTDFELLIADDRSTDNTLSLAQGYAAHDERIKVFRNHQNLGYLKTWNRLIAQAKGDFIAFQDADDSMESSRLQQQYDFLQQHPDHGLVGCNFYYITHDGTSKVSRSDYPLNDEAIRSKTPEECPFCGSATMIRREVYQQIGGYREYFDRIGGEDYDWFFLIMEKYKVANLPDVLYYYRLSANSVTRTFTYAGRRKLFAFPMVQFLYRQRQEKGKDCLQENRPEELQAFEQKLDEPFTHDEAYFYWYIAKKLFYEGDKQGALQFMRRAIRCAPWRLGYYRDYRYFKHI